MTKGLWGVSEKGRLPGLMRFLSAEVRYALGEPGSPSWTACLESCLTHTTLHLKHATVLKSEQNQKFMCS